MTPLCALAAKYGTDKGLSGQNYIGHNYTPVYYELFKDRIALVKRVFEVGIERGCSVRMWEEFFPNAQIFGFDRNPNILINVGRIESFLGNQDNIAELRAAGVASMGTKGFDFIIDDGAHDSKTQLSTALTLLPCLAPEGVYAIEDVKRSKAGPPFNNDQDNIMGRLPTGYISSLVRTGDNSRDGLILICHNNVPRRLG